MSTKSKPKQAKKMSRAKIRPDDDDILEKLRVKRSVSIPALEIDDDESEAPQEPEAEVQTPVEPAPRKTMSVTEAVQNISEPVIVSTPATPPQPTPVAVKTTPTPAPVSAPKPKAQSGAPKLFVSGRLPRKKGTSSRSLQLLHSIEEEMKQYCNGGDLVVLNYLIKLGLEKVKESQEIIIIDSDTL